VACQWRFLPHGFPPWEAVYQQARRWIQAKVFDEIAQELRVVVRIIEDRESHPSAVIMDARTLQSTPESGSRAGYDGHKKKKGSKVHVAVDTLGNLLALAVIASVYDRQKSVTSLLCWDAGANSGMRLAEVRRLG
jgi:transposase